MGSLKKRKPIVALLLSFLTPGLGQIYNGQLKRAVILYSVTLLLTMLRLFTDLFSTLHGMIFCLLSAVGFFLFIMFDALYNAIRLKEITLRKYNRWYLYVTVFLIQIFVISPPTRSLMSFEAYKIPAPSMAPTLQVGDYLVINKKYYKKRKPERNNIVVFRRLGEPSKDYVKRVIGLPGEKIEVRHKKVFINGEPLEEPFETSDDTTIGSINGAPGDNFGPALVPIDSIFVMGDNRDHSYDSRFWGFVDISEVKGKVLYIYWAKDKSRIGMEIR